GQARSSSGGSSDGAGSDQQSLDNRASVLTQQTDSRVNGDKQGQPFLARLDAMLESRGLSLAALVSSDTGDPITSESGPLTQNATGLASIGGGTAHAANSPAATHAPAFTGWTPVAGQVAMQISRMVKDGNQEFTIRLDPPELGRVDVKMDIAHDGKVNAVVTVDNEKTLQLLQRDQALLERALAEAGLKADSGSLNFSLNQRDGAYDGAGSHTGPDGAGQTNVDDDAPASTEAASVMLSDRALDIKV
ncbi:MAG: flagellar hook-length control protein FliK, partial [Alphaproteobacteria bacterium]